MDLVHAEGEPDIAVRVHLADDHTMFREGLRSILSSQEGIEVVGSSSTGPEAVTRVAKRRARCLAQRRKRLRRTLARRTGPAAPRAVGELLAAADGQHFHGEGGVSAAPAVRRTLLGSNTLTLSGGETSAVPPLRLADWKEPPAQLLACLPYDRVAPLAAPQPAGGLHEDPVRVAAVAGLQREGHPQQQPAPSKRFCPLPRTEVHTRGFPAAS